MYSIYRISTILLSKDTLRLSILYFTFEVFLLFPFSNFPSVTMLAKLLQHQQWENVSGNPWETTSNLVITCATVFDVDSGKSHIRWLSSNVWLIASPLLHPPPPLLLCCYLRSVPTTQRDESLALDCIRPKLPFGTQSQTHSCRYRHCHTLLMGHKWWLRGVIFVWVYTLLKL